MLISHLSSRPILDRLTQICLWITLLIGLFGCRAPLITVEEISPKKVGKTVYLTGKVVRLAPLLEHTAYQIKDSTGNVWVVTTQSPPQLNRQVNIKGKIEYQSLPFAEQELGDFYLVELEKLSALP